MATYKIEFDKDGCIGAGSCVAACPDNWELKEDGKASYFKAELTEEELAKNKEAAESCPVNVIHIVNLETGEKII